jgi:hypothetical protein
LLRLSLGLLVMSGLGMADDKRKENSEYICFSGNPDVAQS